jgi:hypothetical protein
MATNPDLNIVDTLDNATIGQLQQAQQLASSAGNTTLSTIIGNTITLALAQSTAPRGPNIGPPNPGPPNPGTPGGPPVGGGGVISNPGVGTPGLGTVPGGVVIGTGGGTFPGGGSPGTGGGPLPGPTPGTNPGGPRFDLPCPNPTYRVGRIKEVKTALLFDPNPDFIEANTIAKQCVLIGEILKCCPIGETVVGYVELSRATVSKYYENCPNGGVKAVIRQYYELDKISLGSFVRQTPDEVGNLISDSSVSNEEANKVFTGNWSNNSCNSQLLDGTQETKLVFSNFEDYFYTTGTEITISGAKRLIKDREVIYSASNKSNPKQVSDNILKNIDASCEYDGPCISTPKPPSGPCPPDGFSVNGILENIIESEYDAENTKAIAAGYTRRTDLDQKYIQTDVQLNTSQEYTPIPGNPCFEAQKTTVVAIEVAAFAYTITYINGCDETKYIRVTRTREIENRYLQKRPIQSKINSPECKCEEQLIDAGILLDTTDPCGCKQYNLVKVRLKCPDGTETDSTEIYRDGIPVGLNLPAGHKLDPFIPFSLRADCQDEPIKIYHKLILGKDIVEAKVTSNTRGLFNLEQSMSCYHTSSLQSTASRTYYREVTDCDCDSTSYFAVAYGHISGSGSLNSVGETNDTATRAVYSQYRLLALEEPERKFKFYNNGTLSESDDIYAINFYRNALSDRIDPGNFEVALRQLNGGAYANNVHTGSNVQPSSSTQIHTFIDNSGDRSDLAFCSEDPHVSYDIVSGSLESGIHDSGTGSISTNPNITTYGRFYPNLGIMIFNPTKLNTLLGFNTVTGSNIAGDNAFKLYTSISGSGNLSSHMKARNVKFKTTNHYFVRVSPPNANYSNNPTFISDTSTGKLLNTCFQKEPVTYVTSVGLYNDRRELLAIAKLSKPTKKTPDDDLLIKIRLNW